MQHRHHNHISFTCVLSLFLLLAANAQAQPHYSQVLQYAEKHNPTLQAATKRAEAEKTAAHLGALLPDPEIGAAYYWGDPAELGKRWDLHVTQSFDMPSVMIRKARLRNLEEQAAELNYQLVRTNLLLEIQEMCADWIYYHGVAEVYSRRRESAYHMAQLYQKRFETGDCSVLEYNRAQMYLADMQNMESEALLKEDHATHHLRLLAGGNDFPAFSPEYEPVKIESNFEDWYQALEMRNPTLRLLDNQVEASNQQMQLSRAEWLPTMDLGYNSENRVGETFRGVTVGLSIPLWSQQRAVRTARLRAEASQMELESQRSQIRTHLSCTFHRHATLMHNVESLKKALRQHDSQTYLEQALEAGEISLEQYLQQTDYYYNIELQIWETSHELELLHLFLYAVEL